ncbi:MAG: N-acetylneuraminate synthase family protein [Planctomycetes bacterium]|nr:N-acetylneuraminate synthase family protein [Thermoplasmata archaeon]MBE3143545.1 N-acetylneuraminate synthase family protein [Planctomycetota bacterium]
MLIAEIGQNHCGDTELAKHLIYLAKQNGADLAKFQLYDSTALYGERQKSELSKDDAFYLFGYGKSIGIDVFFSVFDLERVKWCEEMGVKYYKLAYSQRDNESLRLAVAKTNKPFWISGWHLYCIPKYPTKLEDLKFEAGMFDVKEYEDEPEYIGYSDHTIGIDACKIAMARGAKIIEKHFAIDHKTGVDAPWSMTPDELKELSEWEKTVKCVL